MEHLVPRDVAEALRAAGLRPTGPFAGAERRARWAALDADGGRWAVLEVEPRHAGAARARARQLARVRHDALGAPGPVLDLPEGGVLVLGAAPPGTDLGTLLAARGALEAGEVVGLLAPVAEALAALHAAGVLHGAPGECDVVLTDEGPVLVDGGGRRPGGAPATRAGDVAGIAALGLTALGTTAVGTGTLGTAVLGRGTTGGAGGSSARGSEPAAAVRAVCAAPPEDASALAAALRAAAPGVLPVLPAPEVLASLALRRLTGDRSAGAPGAARGRHRAGRPVRRRLGLAAAALVASLGVAGAVHGPPAAREHPTPGPTASAHVAPAPPAESARAATAPATAAAPDPGGWRRTARRAAGALSVARLRAQAARSASALLALSEPGSPAALADVAAARGWTSPRAPAPVAALAELRVAVGAPALAGCAAGLVCVPVRTTARLAGGAPTSTAVTLALRPGTWRVVSVGPP